MENKKISVIITTYGGSRKLVRAINSVLEQTYQNFEIIVVDDNDPNSDARKATESYMSIFSDERIKYIKHEKNKNGSFARNTGIANSEGYYVSFLDDDDYYINNRFEYIVDVMEKNKEIDGVCTGTIEMCAGFITGEVTYREKYLKPKMLLINQGSIGTGSNIFVKKEIVNEIGGFDILFNRFQDVEFMIRITNKYNILLDSHLLVVKDVTETHIPTYKKVFDAFVLFNEKFRSFINDLNEDERRYYFQDRYESLIYLAKLSCDKEIYNNACRQLKEYIGSKIEIKTNNNFYSPIMYKLKMVMKNNIVVFNIIKTIKSIKRSKRNKVLLKNKQLSKKYFENY